MKLKEFRIKNNLTQDELAKKLGLTQYTYSNYESGKTEPKIEVLKNLANFFNTTIDEIVGVSKTKNINLTERNSLLDVIDSLTEIECHKLKIFAEGLISNRIEKTSAFKVLKDDRE